MQLELRYPADFEHAIDHADLAVEIARQEYDYELDYLPQSIDAVDAQIESLREDGLTAEDAAETLFAFGCYLGEVLRRAAGGRWLPTVHSALAGVSPWPMVIGLTHGSSWDPIGKVFKRFELGDSESLTGFFIGAIEIDAARATR
jgi:hypothetical protein